MAVVRAFAGAVAALIAWAGVAVAAPWDGEWEGTVRHPDLLCSPCKVRLTISGGLPNIRSSASIPTFTIGSDGAVLAEMPVQVAGNALRSTCRLQGRAKGGLIAASGTCGNYSTLAEMELRRISAASEETAVAALPSPSPPAAAATPPAAPRAAPRPAARVPAGFGAGTEPIRLGEVAYTMEPGTPIGEITSGSWLSSCGANGRFVPIKHQASMQPNRKVLAEEFSRAMREAGYTARSAGDASYLVVGRVGTMNLSICIRENTRPLQSSGSGTVSIEWSVVSLRSGASAYQTTTTGTFDLPAGERSTEGIREVFAGTYRDALRRLAAERGFRDAVAAAPTAVSVSAGGPSLTLARTPRFGGGITANMNRILPSVVEVRRGSGVGTGFVVDPRGYLLTNAHVVGNADTVTLRFNDGRSVEAAVERRDTLRDIALLKIDGPGLRPLPIRTGKLTLTEKVYAIGSPLGLSQTVTDGIVSAYRQSPNTAQEYIQASVSITFGNSGGPLLDANGNVVGVSVSAAFGGGLGLNFFIPIESALEHLNLRHGG